MEQIKITKWRNVALATFGGKMVKIVRTYDGGHNVVFVTNDFNELDPPFRYDTSKGEARLCVGISEEALEALSMLWQIIKTSPLQIPTPPATEPPPAR